MSRVSLRNLFAGFVRTRKISRHYRRHAVFESLVTSADDRVVPAELSRVLVEASHKPVDELLRALGTHADGLSEGQARQRLRRVGFNEVQHEKPLPWWVHLWHCYKNPFNLLLTILAVVSHFTGDNRAMVVIGAMVVLSTGIRFAQEARSHKAADRLKDMVTNTATVLRREWSVEPGRGGAVAPVAQTAPMHSHAAAGHPVEVAVRHLVPGDVVRLSAGDMIPADLRILAARDLFIAQAAMTGESLPVEKFADDRGPESANPLDLDNIVFMGTNVVSGSATAVVLATGVRTYFGDLAARVAEAAPVVTAFQAGVNKVSWLLIRFMLVMTPIVFLLNGLTKGDWLEAFLFAMSVAIGLTPEMLPMIVTSTLAKGAVMLSRKQVIVKRLDAIQNFGAMNVLCTDKTGTLTQDKILLERYTDALGAQGKDGDRVLEYAYLNSYYQTGLKNLLDVAVLEHAEVHQDLKAAERFHKVDEIPFDFQRRRMSVVVAEDARDAQPPRHLLICKGALEEVLAACTRVQRGAASEALTPDTEVQIHAVARDFNQEGLRVVAVAFRELPPTQSVVSVADEADLTLAGYVAFLDPPKETTAPALRALAAHGVDVKVLTGDNELVTARICQQVGLNITGLLSGAQVEALDDAALASEVERCNVFVKLAPAQKERVVSALRKNGHVVGFMGDGINDAPALRAADIGISVDTAVDIAKEAADIILLEKSLMVLDEGVLEGRRTFTNMLKYIKMTASSNFGNVFSVLVASAFLPFLPMLPLQLLVQNLLYDISQTGIPFDTVDEEQVARPQAWNAEDIGRFMFTFGPVSSVFDILTYGLMWFVFAANTPAQQSLFQAGWFMEGLLSQTLIVHMIRTRRIPFVQSQPGPVLLGMTLLVVVAGIFIATGPFAHYFRFEPPPMAYFGYLGALLLGYAALVQGMKTVYIRRFGWQ